MVAAGGEGLLRRKNGVSDLSELKPTERFTGLTDLYVRYRPDYPAAAIDFIVAHCGLERDSLLVDVGCGPGISSRIFSSRGIAVVGIEPNAEMRQRAIEEGAPPGGGNLTYQAGTAEATGLPDGFADAVVSAQAFHWFDAGRALAEFRRILKSEGWVALVWNERDESDAFTAAYGQVLRSTREGSQVESRHGRSGLALLQSSLYRRAERVTFAHQQVLDEEGVLGRARSASYAPREPVALDAFSTALRQAFVRCQRNGTVTLHYVTSVYVGQRV
jgi:SAM-dependent methyltransferase